MDLNMTFVDSVKAFDTVSRDGLWKIIIPADAFQDYNDCFPISYRVNGNLFKIRLEAKSKIQTDVLDELLYADCVAQKI